MSHPPLPDARSMRVVLVAHCILNQNAIVDGTAAFSGCIEPVVAFLNASGVGILQMPCPELRCLGLARGNIGREPGPVLEENTRIRGLMEGEAPRRRNRELVEGLVSQILEYTTRGVDVCGVIGINRSPCCGVETTTDRNQEVAGQGVFIGALQEELRQAGVPVEMVGIRASQPREAVEKVRALLHS